MSQESLLVHCKRAKTNWGSGSAQSDRAGIAQIAKNKSRTKIRFKRVSWVLSLSVGHRVDSIIYAEFHCQPGVVQRTLTDIERLPVFADVVIEVDHDLNISLRIHDAKKLRFAGREDT